MRQDKASYFLDYNLVNSFRNLLIMETKEFKTMFGKIAKSNGFKFLYGGWYKESDDSMVIISLVHSYYSRLYYFRPKINIRGVFGRNSISKIDVQSDVANIELFCPKEYYDLFNLETNLNENTRKNMIEKLFETYVVPLTNKALSLEGIEELANAGEIQIEPVVKEELDKKLQEKTAKAKNAEEQ